MNLDLSALAHDCERALVARADGGVNADPPADMRPKPRVSVASGLCPLATQRYLEGAEKAATDVPYAANTQTGMAMEGLILLVMQDALREQIPGFLWDTFPDENDDENRWQPPRMDCGPAIGRPDAISVQHRIIGDAKSASASQFAMKIKDGGKGYRVAQTLYLKGAELAYGAPFTSLVCVMNKETKKGTPVAFALFRYEPDETIVAQVAGQVQEARTGQARCPFRRGKDWNVDYCAYRNHPGCGGA